jgi:ferritin-like metal-binding protein YciE
MAGYGVAQSLAEALGHDDVVELLGETLAEEEETETKLTDLAASVIVPEAQAEK